MSMIYYILLIFLIFRGEKVRVIIAVLMCIGIMYGKNILTMAVSGNVGVMNPQGYQGNEMFAQNAIYEGLVSVDKKGNVIPSLATSWSVSKDGLSYDFILRENVKFSNGEAFNADAVVINFTSVLKNRIRHSWSGLSLHLEGVEKLGEFKVRLKLKAPYTPTLNELAVPRPFRFLAPSAFPQDLNLIKHNPKPIGTGPYMLTQSVLGVSDTMQKNPHYWNKDAYNGMYYDEIFFKVIFDPNSKIAALKSGQVDLIYGNDQIPLEIFKSMRKDSKFATYLSPPIRSTSLLLNSSAPVFILNDEKDSIALRKNIILGIDKTKIVRAVFGDLQESADMLFSPIFYQTLGTQVLFSTPYQPQEAKQAIVLLLQDSKATLLREKGVEILFVGNNPVHRMMAEILQNEFKKLGIKVRLSASEPTIYANRLLQGAFDIAFHETWGMPYEPLSELYSMRVPGHGSYAALSGLSSRATIEELILRLISLPPKTKAFLDTLNEVVVLLRDSSIFIPLTYQRNKAVAHKKIKGINMGVLGYEVPFWEMYE